MLFRLVTGKRKKEGTSFFILIVTYQKERERGGKEGGRATIGKLKEKGRRAVIVGF